MDATKVYQSLEKDFKITHFSEAWPDLAINKYILPSFSSLGNGLMYSNSKQIEQVYTAVFPSNYVVHKILNLNLKDSLLVTHHPLEWDSRINPPWINLEKKILSQLKINRISLCSMHLPLDVLGPYSTSLNLANALDIAIQGEFFIFNNVNVAVYGTCKYNKTDDLMEAVSEKVGHKVKIFQYGNSTIRDNRVGIIPGGRPKEENMKELISLGINTIVTGIAGKNNHTEKDHIFAEKNRINIIGATHYSSEMFSAMALTEYFKKIGLESSFIEDFPMLEDSDIN
jgi:putative NIF3 family GTP cyclohydrolase 1 type 2